MDVATGITLGFDLQGGFEILYQVVPKEGQVITNDLLIHTQAALERRVKRLGVSEPDLRIEGNDRIRVKLAGVTDQDQARRMLATEAHLSFSDEYDNLLMGGDNLEEGSAHELYLMRPMNPLLRSSLRMLLLAREVTSEII